MAAKDSTGAHVGEHSVGDVLDLLMFSGGRFRHVTVVVAAAAANAK